MRQSFFLLCVTAAVLAALCGGCTKTITITRYPAFYDPSLKSVAVVPFRGNNSAASLAISDALAGAMAANGTYAVYNRNDLAALMNEKDLQLAFGGDAAAAASQFSKLGKVQAILVGNLVTYAATTRNEPKSDPIYSYDGNGNSYVSGYRKYVLTRNEANVAVTATLIRVADGRPIHATPQQLKATSWAQGSPPPRDAHGCLANAVDGVVGQMVAEFAVTQCQIKVNPNEDCRTAAALYDNKWEYADRFSTQDDKMFVVVKLPGVCNNNRFRLTIVRSGERVDLATHDLLWSSKFGSFGYGFSPREIAAKGGGAGEYIAKFYSGPEPVMTHAFRIEETRPK
ncbi:MAG: CsgG/HfaB family protein [Planctomycetaceae bacterium]|nr:CsgG/HfaB family protein [Planctomycetaceae bacterium]